jgi:hypothetical protein
MTVLSVSADGLVVTTIEALQFNHYGGAGAGRTGALVNPGPTQARFNRPA